jgi:hypothetical protein
VPAILASIRSQELQHNMIVIPAILAQPGLHAPESRNFVGAYGIRPRMDALFTGMNKRE